MKTIYPDFENNAIVITSKAVAKRAGILGSVEYNLLKQMMNDYPDYTLTVKEREATSNVNKRLSYEDMKDYFRANMDEAAAKTACAELDTLRRKHQLNSHAYTVIQNWFFTQCPDVKAQFEKNKQDAARKREEKKQKAITKKRGILGLVNKEEN